MRGPRGRAWRRKGAPPGSHPLLPTSVVGVEERDVAVEVDPIDALDLDGDVFSQHLDAPSC